MRRFATLLATALMLLSVACGGGAEGSADASQPSDGGGDAPVKTDKVELPKSYRFSPASIEVEPGTEVTWTNRDDFPHTVRLLDGDRSDHKIAVGKSVSIAFDEPGTYRYDCSLHPTQMKGEVVVREASQ